MKTYLGIELGSTRIKAVSIDEAHIPVSSGGEVDTKLYEKSLEGDPDCGGILVCNYMAGEGVTHMDAGRTGNSCFRHYPWRLLLRSLCG